MLITWQTTTVFLRQGLRGGAINVMTIPDFQSVMRPVLAALADGETHSTRSLIEKLADELRLSEEERIQLIASGSKKWNNRVNWAVTYLNQAGLIERPMRAHARITAQGLSALAANPKRIDMRTLDAYPGYQEFRQRTRSAKRSPDSPTNALVTEVSGDSPQELIEAALAENKAAIEGELLKLALGLDPNGFELLVVRLLEKMGYGQRGQIEHSGQPGDHGIDGIISQDPLGLDRIYLQAKRYSDASVQRPELQKFVGALMGAQGDRGVFITASTFTSGAKEEAQRVNARIELIDGRRLAELMLKHGVGTQPESTVTLFRVDEDFFDTL